MYKVQSPQHKSETKGILQHIWHTYYMYVSRIFVLDKSICGLETQPTKKARQMAGGMRVRVLAFHVYERFEARQPISSS